MKKLFCSLLLVAAAAATAHADIQAPPVSDQGPTRKFGRGLSNFLFGISELPYQIALINDTEGNSAAHGYGVVRGVGRSFVRGSIGFYEMVTAPFPLNKGKYTPTLKNNVPWIYGGYEEFPPELGWESRYNYVRQ